MTRKTATLEECRKKKVKLAEIAHRELSLGSFSNADEKRIQCMWEAIQILDEEQSDWHGKALESRLEIDRLKAEIKG